MNTASPSAVRGEKNDVLLIPAGLPHWIDIGDNPHFVTLHLFNTAEGEAVLTDDEIARRFPGLDD